MDLWHIILVPPSSLADGVFVYGFPPPTPDELFSTREALGLPSTIHRDPFYSIVADRPTRAIEVAGKSFLVPGSGLNSFPEWEDDVYSIEAGHMFTDNTASRVMSYVIEDLSSNDVGWEYACLPPGQAEIHEWLKKYPKNIDASPPVLPSRSQVNSKLSVIIGAN